MPSCDSHGYYSGPFCTDCEATGGPLSASAADYRLFNEDRKLGQNQYASRYVDGSLGYKNLGYGLRFLGDTSDYHQIYIHKDDYAVFQERVLHHRSSSHE